MFPLVWSLFFSFIHFKSPFSGCCVQVSCCFLIVLSVDTITMLFAKSRRLRIYPDILPPPPQFLKELDKMLPKYRAKSIGVSILGWLQFPLQTTLSAHHWLVLYCQAILYRLQTLNQLAAKTIPLEYFAQTLSVNWVKCFLKANKCAKQGFIWSLCLQDLTKNK